MSVLALFVVPLLAFSAVASDAKPQADAPVVDPACRSGQAAAEDQWQAAQHWAATIGCRGTEATTTTERTVQRCLANAEAAAELQAHLNAHFEHRRGPTHAHQRLESVEQSSELNGRTNQTWLDPRLHTGRRTLALTWAPGRGRSQVRICIHRPDGSATAIGPIRHRGQRGRAARVEQRLDLEGPSLISVQVQGLERRGRLPYSLGIQSPKLTTPQLQLEKTTTRASTQISGLVDLHALQMLPLADRISDRHVLHSPHRSLTDGLAATHLKAAHARGLRVLVATAYGKQLTAEERAAGLRTHDLVTAQLAAIQAFAARHDFYRIARSSAQARQIIAEGDLAVIIAVQSSDPLPTKRGDWRRQLDELEAAGVRILHLADGSDNRFVGHATTSGTRNERGLTPEGQALVGALIHRRMLFPLDGVSRQARQDIYDLVSDRDYEARAALEQLTQNRQPPRFDHYPIFFAHTTLTSLLANADWLQMRVSSPLSAELRRRLDQQRLGEGSALDNEVYWVRSTGGMLGLGFDAVATRNAVGSGVSNDCPGSSQTFAQVVAYAQARFGVAVGIGSSLNLTGAPTLGPHRGPSACLGHPPRSAPGVRQKTGTSLAQTGLSKIGQLPQLVENLQQLGLDTRKLEGSAEAFLRMWARAEGDRRGRLSATDYAHRISLQTATSPRTSARPAI